MMVRSKKTAKSAETPLQVRWAALPHRNPIKYNMFRDHDRRQPAEAVLAGRTGKLWPQ